ncbi:hypothetical protein [Streptomyces acidicola]|nr:hypothetical protein [Streptomyces acidicola]
MPDPGGQHAEPARESGAASTKTGTDSYRLASTRARAEEPAKAG